EPGTRSGAGRALSRDAAARRVLADRVCDALRIDPAGGVELAVGAAQPGPGLGADDIAFGFRRRGADDTRHPGRRPAGGGHPGGASPPAGAACGRATTDRRHRLSRLLGTAARGGPMNLTGKVALVTGASRGVGAATAVALAEAGCRVACAARSTQAAPQ